jgi:hypothetical protein
MRLRQFTDFYQVIGNILQLDEKLKPLKMKSVNF